MKSKHKGFVEYLVRHFLGWVKSERQILGQYKIDGEKSKLHLVHKTFKNYSENKEIIHLVCITTETFQF